MWLWSPLPVPTQKPTHRCKRTCVKIEVRALPVPLEETTEKEQRIMTGTTYRNLEFNLAIPACDLTDKMTRTIDEHGLTVTKIDTRHEMQAGIREPMLFVTFTLEAGDEQVKVDSVILPGNDWAVMQVIEHSNNTDFIVCTHPADEYAMPIDIKYVGEPISIAD